MNDALLAPDETPSDVLRGACPVKIAEIPFEQWNAPRRGCLLVNAERLEK
jgi:hypothetical protein